MKIKYLLTTTLFATLLSATTIFAQQQPQGQPSPEEMARKEAERLEEELNLQYHQTFYVDSILQYNFKALTDEFQQLQLSGKMERSVYDAVREKWLAKTDSAYRKVFTEEQFEKYLVISGQKQRDKAAERDAKRKEKEAKRLKKLQEKAAQKAAKQKQK